MNNAHLKNDYLDKSVITSFRDAINSSPIFHELDSLKRFYNRICVFNDRIKSAVDFLNEHSNLPETEEELILILVYMAILKDGVSKLYENLFEHKPPFVLQKKYFVDVRTFGGLFFSKENCPTDDSFFEYLRALSFAHPYDVSDRIKDRPFLNNGEIHCCPWVFIRSPLIAFDGINDAIGVKLYSNVAENDNKDVFFSYSVLKKYIKSRYECISELTQFVNDKIIEVIDGWKQIKINRDQEPTKVLEEIKKRLQERFVNSYSIDLAINYLRCPLSNPKNNKSVEIFRGAILESIPEVCDCVDKMEYEKMEDTLFMLSVRPRNMHEMAYYQLEKIELYLNERSEEIDEMSDEFWGLKQAYDFSMEFAKKWVEIDVMSMPYEEIKLLVQVSCFLEAQLQNNKYNVNNGN